MVGVVVSVVCWSVVRPIVVIPILPLLGPSFCSPAGNQVGTFARLLPSIYHDYMGCCCNLFVFVLVVVA